MVILPPNRRALLAGLGAMVCVPRAALAEDVIDLKWRDLVPDGETPIPPSVQGLFGHDETVGLVLSD